MYEYEAEVLSVYDGDTIRLRVDLGMDTYVKQSARLDGVDTPEISGLERPAGLDAKMYAERWLSRHGAERMGKYHVRIQTIKDKREKYGRYLVVVFALDGSNRCLNEDLIESGHAIPYTGGAR